VSWPAYAPKPRWVRSRPTHGQAPKSARTGTSCCPLREQALGATTLRKWTAGSWEPNRCHAVSPQRAIRMGNVLGNSKSPTTLRL